MTIKDLPVFRTLPFIDGGFTEPLTAESLSTVNPATGQPLCDIAACGVADVDRAVSAARVAFEDGRWARRTPEERKLSLLGLAALLETHQEELALLDALEGGKPITDCREIDIPEAIRTFRWHAEAIDKVFGAIAPTGYDSLGLITKEPIGVVGAVLAWNFPALLLAWKAGPALAAGNSVVVKPAEQTSLSALRIAELAAEAGIPDGVFNVVPGRGETAGQAIGRHKDIDAVSFTGSTEVGRLFLQYAAESNLKAVVLECGGKSPQIVMPDASDLDVVAADVLTAGYWNMGENCSCGSRLLVHESIKDELIERLVRGSAAWTVGDPLQSETRLGPLIEEQHLKKVLDFVTSGCDEGAHLVLGGNRILEETGGYFMRPTILDNVDPDTRVAREEIFGPVIAIMSFGTEEDAIAIANRTNYGLAASLWTSNIDSALRIARAIRAGTVSINSYSEGDVSTPFGGYKESGFGGRDKGLEAFDQYTEVKTIWVTIR